jgi:hypothetical protein
MNTIFSNTASSGGFGNRKPIVKGMIVTGIKTIPLTIIPLTTQLF